MNFKNKPYDVETLQGKKIAVIGLGVEGESSVRYLKKQGAEVTVLDKKDSEDYLKDLDKYDLIVRSPGVQLNKIQNSEFRIQNSIITSQTKLFFDLCPCKIIGVTGTKGKGTTSSLIYEMLKKSFDSAQDKAEKNVYLGGNIGQPPLDFLNKLNDQSLVVLELSSFQLQDLTKSPYIAVVLMITSEHLDYHKDIDEYVDAKRNILKFQTASDFAIVNRDYPASNESDIQTEGKVYFVSREREVEEGCFVKDGKIFIRLGTEVTRSPLRSACQFDEFSNASVPAVASGDLGIRSDVHRSLAKTSSHGKPPRGDPRSSQYPNIFEEQVIDTNDILLPGTHNLENVCAAVMAATLSGVSKQNIIHVLKTFKGLEHRLELVDEINGVSYYDDSFSTTPETAIAAIQAFKQPKILILGGSSKGSDFTELGQIISKDESIKAIIGIGEEWSRMKAEFPISNFQFPIIEGAKNMLQIAQAASKIAKPGDVVLLTPACASFGMFKNYKDRGEQFKREVEKLKN
ncbi:MAG: UDP-N-acetylmuramoyl-L-alanine--D-glutamate ligase [Patescibacteria group bacterium]|nr:UDP-N-acetylmuramoyl-L-alanine--D-glutamate ligase [Patescibacteria group bacterium]